MAAIGCKAVIGLDSIQHGLFDNEHPGYARCSIVQFIGIPSLPNLISLWVERSAWELYQKLLKESSRQTADKRWSNLLPDWLRCPTTCSYHSASSGPDTAMLSNTMV